ncbi:hypothetical protein QLS91_17340, partial [Flavobacterium sp. LB2P84]|uniref:beta strand repeat-containing protein n=1 Tax=Flavobacterium yafengii TaxID=3041253 RepID=UPI0024A9D348
SCTATAQVTITQPAVAVSVSGIATNATCFGEANGSIAVTNSVGATVVITNADNEVVSNTGLVAGTYTLTASAPNGNANGSCTATAQVTITQPAVAVSVSGIATNATCFGEANGSIAVTNSAGSTVVITNTQNQVVSNTGLVAGTYTLTASAPNGNTNGSCTATAQVTITQPAVAVSVSGIATNATCFGEANGSIAVTNSAGSTVVITNTQNQVVSNTGLVAGTYTLTASAPNGNTNGSCTATAQVIITQPAVAVSVSGIATNATCFGEANGSIAVTNSAGSTVVITNAQNQVVSNTNLPAGTYTLTASAPNGNANGSCTATAQVTITQPAVAVSVSGIATNATCFGEANGSIAVTNSAGSTVVITNAQNQVVSNTNLPAGTYTLTASAPNGNANGSCTATAQVTITQPTVAVSVSGIATNATCFGEANGSIAVTNSAGATVVITNTQNQVVSNTNLPAGTYTLTASAPNGNTNGSCTATAQVTITQPAVAVSVSGIATNATCFGEANGSIAVTNSVGATVVITNADNEVVSNTGLVAGTYTLTASAPNGNANGSCTATAQVTITQPAVAVSVSGIATNATCYEGSDGSIAVTNSVGAIVVITNSTNQEVSNTNLPAGTYTLTATATGGNQGQNCTATATVTINDGDGTPPVISQLPNETTINCPATPEFAEASATDYVDTSVSLTFDDVTTKGQCAGSYSVTRTWKAVDDCGNSSTKSQTINVQDITAPTFTVPANITINAGANCIANVDPSTTGTVTNIKDTCDSNPAVSYSDTDCFGTADDTEINAGNGNYFPFTISGYDGLSASKIENIALTFETNQGKGRAEFTLVAPNGQAVILVGPYCEGGNCDDASPSSTETYSPVFYPNSSGYTQWNNNNNIQEGVSLNFTPNGATTSTNTITGLTSFVSSFENLTGLMNGTWFIFSRKQASVNGSIKFKSVCMKPASECAGNKIISRTWTVTDACGNKTTANQTIKIQDTTAPVFVEALPANVTVQCSAVPTAPTLTATDNCGDATVTF